MGVFRLTLNIRRLYCTQTNASIMKYLNVAEKNDAAKNIAAILSGGASTRVCISQQLEKAYLINQVNSSEKVYQLTTKSMNLTVRSTANRPGW